jgi:hypothetical protein
LKGAFTSDDAKELIRRRARVLTKLQTLSNGTTTTIDGAGITDKPRAHIAQGDPKAGLKRALAASPGASGKRAMEGSLPPGTKARRDLNETREGPPDRNEDLHGHYHFRFVACKGDYWQTLSLCAQAERDHAREVRGNSRPANEDGPNRTKRLLVDYAGVAYWEVATYENMHPEAVKRTRREGGLDPEYGQEVRVDPRLARILEMKAQHMSERTIADEMGISKTRVRQLLGSDVA